MKDLPGFFYNEEKGKYFPIHMKEAYEKEKEALKREQEKKVIEESEKTTDLYKFIGNSSLKFDSILERISRIHVNEIIWPNKLQIEVGDDRYYRYNFQDGQHVIQQFKLSTGEEVDTIQFSNALILRDFFVSCNYDYKCVYYLKFSDYNLSTATTVILASGRLYTARSRPEYSHLNAACLEFRLYYEWGYQNLELRYLEDDIVYDSNLIEELPANFEFFTAFREIGLVRVYSGGLIKLRRQKIKLKESSAKWLYYYEGMLLILTYHGELLTVTLNTGEEEKIIDVHDFDFKDCRFEDLLIDAQNKVVVIGYKNKNELIFFNWVDKKVIKKLVRIKPIEQFKLSSNLLNLYIQVLQ